MGDSENTTPTPPTPEQPAPGQPPDIRTLDQHALVDNRVPVDQSQLGDYELAPTSDPNYSYLKPKS